MYCVILRKKINEYIEGDIDDDLNRTIEEHMEQCENCKKLYEDELRITLMLKMAFTANNIKFKSCRNNVIKSINRARYGKGFMNNLKLQLSKLTYLNKL